MQKFQHATKFTSAPMLLSFYFFLTFQIQQENKYTNLSCV